MLGGEYACEKCRFISSIVVWHNLACWSSVLTGVMSDGLNEDVRQKVAALIANLSVEHQQARAMLCSNEVCIPSRPYSRTLVAFPCNPTLTYSEL